MYVWWMVCGWMASSGLLVLVVEWACEFSLPREVVLPRYYVFCTIRAGFGIHLAYEDNRSDLTRYQLYLHVT